VVDVRDDGEVSTASSEKVRALDVKLCTRRNEMLG
jgi:hypothetical protein